jgi:hypothetical protein
VQTLFEGLEGLGVGLEEVVGDVCYSEEEFRGGSRNVG